MSEFPDIVTVTGAGFGRNASELSVHLGGAEVEILSATDTEIRLRVNDQVASGEVVVSRGGRPGGEQE